MKRTSPALPTAPPCCSLEPTLDILTSSAAHCMFIIVGYAVLAAGWLETGSSGGVVSLPGAPRAARAALERDRCKQGEKRCPASKKEIYFSTHKHCSGSPSSSASSSRG
ncbi:hypothetical protein GN956_G12509 [Arapaima gigas]